MKIKLSTPHVLVSLVGLVLITGLVPARAEGSPDDVFLRPQLSPFVTLKSEIVSLDGGTSVSDSGTNYQLETGSLAQATDTSGELQLMDLLSKVFTSKMEETSIKDDNSFFTKLSLQSNASQSDDTTTMISNIHVKTNSSSSVTIMWQLNKFADVTIYYDTKEKVEAAPSTPSVKISAFRFANEATIEGLQSDTTYHYLLVVDNHFSKATTISSGSFRTAP